LDLGPAIGRFEAGVVISARVAGHDAATKLTRFDLPGGAALVAPGPAPPLGTEARLRIRARDVALATKRPEGLSIRNILPGTIVELAAEADTAFAETLVDIGGLRIRARITRAAADELGLAPGRPVFALIKSVAFDRSAVAADPGPADAG